MPKKLNYQLTEAELTVVRQAIANDKRPEVRHRAMAIQLLHQGMKPQEVADMLVVSLGSIYKWHARWREGGLDALADQPRSGAPRRADDAYWQRVGEIIDQDPAALGYDFALWTAERLITHMAEETGVDQSKLFGIYLTPGNADDRKPAPRLAQSLFGKLIGSTFVRPS